MENTNENTMTWEFRGGGMIFPKMYHYTIGQAEMFGEVGIDLEYDPHSGEVWAFLVRNQHRTIMLVNPADYREGHSLEDIRLIAYRAAIHRLRLDYMDLGLMLDKVKAENVVGFTTPPAPDEPVSFKEYMQGTTAQRLELRLSGAAPKDFAGPNGI